MSSGPNSSSTANWPPWLADPATRLGQLQRGLGSGARAAIAAGSEAAADVLACVAHDPRWDRQLDARGGYYARLVVALDIDVDEIAQLLETHESRIAPDGLDRTPIALGMLEQLVGRNVPEAIETLREQARHGRHWAAAINALAYARHHDERPRWEQNTAGLADALVTRWPTARALALEFNGHWEVQGDRLPWSVWEQAHPLIAEALRWEEDGSPTRRAKSDFTGFTTAELLAHDRAGESYAVGRELLTRRSPADTESIRATAADLGAPMYAAATWALAERGARDALAPVAATLRAGLRPGVHGALFRALQALPFDQTRSVAYDWLGSDPDRSRRQAGASILQDHGGPEEVPFIRSMLTRELDAGLNGNQYIVCSLAEALGYNPQVGPYPELDRAFKEMPYSFGRSYVADALARTDPSFPTGLAIDCLWDACDSVRSTGVESVDRTLPAAAERLREMADDPNEEPETRQAARGS